MVIFESALRSHCLRGPTFGLAFLKRPTVGLTGPVLIGLSGGISDRAISPGLSVSSTHDPLSSDRLRLPSIPRWVGQRYPAYGPRPCFAVRARSVAPGALGSVG